MKRIHLAALGFGLASTLVGCTTTATTPGAKTSPDEAVMHSSGRDDRAVESAARDYQFEVNNYNAFFDRIDWSNYFEDIETKKRTNFVVFKNGDTQCTVGLTTEQMAFIKARPHMVLKIRTAPPGRTGLLNQSQLFFNYKNDTTNTNEEFLASCLQPDHRIAMKDLSAALGDFIYPKAASDASPKYDVCCRCNVDIFQAKEKAGDTLLIKGEHAYLIMNDSNDSVCNTRLNNKRHALRPGDPHYRVQEIRFQQWTGCEEVRHEKCAGTYTDGREAGGDLMDRLSDIDLAPQPAVSRETPAPTQNTGIAVQAAPIAAPAVQPNAISEEDPSDLGPDVSSPVDGSRSAENVIPAAAPVAPIDPLVSPKSASADDGSLTRSKQ